MSARYWWRITVGIESVERGVQEGQAVRTRRSDERRVVHEHLTEFKAAAIRVERIGAD